MKLIRKKHLIGLFVLCFVLFEALLSVNAATPSLSKSRYMKTYVLSTKNNTYVYTNTSLKTRGTSSPYKAYNAVIYATDEIYVYSINNSYAYISYPTSSGRKYGYIKTSAITSNNYSQNAKNSRAKIITYKRPGSGEYGYISKGDSVYTVAQSGNYKQVIYPTGSTWKMGWISNSNYNTYIAGGYNPEGGCDITGGIKSVKIKGWTLDKDSKSTSLGVHVYIGGPAGVGEGHAGITANAYRPDIPKNLADPALGNYHGLDTTVYTNKTGYQDVYVYALNVGSGENIVLGHKKVYISGGYNSEGAFDRVTSNANKQITVKGWAFDRDNLNASLQIHVYVGGPAGSGAPGYVLTANKYRPDVNNVYKGVGNNHGYEGSINVSRTGRQTVYIYAISVGGGENTLLGYKDVDIKGGETSNSSGIFQYPVSNYYVCGNDWRTYYSKRPSRPYHVGIDIASKNGDTAIYAAASGTVAKVGWNNANGNYVVLKHNISGKPVYSFYAHLSKYTVSSGKSVSKGTKIGVIGNTGSEQTGTHLHFAITNTLWSGSYYGYATKFSGDKTTYAGVTYYNPHYVIKYNKLP